MPPVISIRENGVMKMIRPIVCPLAGPLPATEIRIKCREIEPPAPPRTPPPARGGAAAVGRFPADIHPRSMFTRVPKAKPPGVARRGLAVCKDRPGDDEKKLRCQGNIGDQTFWSSMMPLTTAGREP